MGRSLVLLLAIGIAACGSKNDEAKSSPAIEDPEPVANEAVEDLGPAPDVPALRFATGPCGPAPAAGGGNDARGGGGGVDISSNQGAGKPALPDEPELPAGFVSVKLESVEGGLDEKIVKRYLRRYTPRIRFCYQRALSQGAAFGTKVKARFIIDVEGKVQSPGLSGNNRGNMFSCIEAALVSRAFPKSEDGGIVRVEAVFVLASEEERTAKKRPKRKKPQQKVPVGSYDYEKVRVVLASNAETLSTCLAASHEAEPKIRGTFGVAFTVPDSGSPTGVEVDAPLADDVKTCLAQATAKLEFPTHSLKLSQNVRCYFEYGTIGVDEARSKAPLVEVTEAGVTIDGVEVTSIAAALEPSGDVSIDRFGIIRAAADVSYKAVYPAYAELQAAGVRYIVFDTKEPAGWKLAYLPPAPRARYHGDAIEHEPLHIHITADAIRVRGAKKIRAKDDQHDFEAIGVALEKLVEKGTYAHRVDVAVQADGDVPYSDLMRVIQDAVRHGLTHVELQAPTR